MTDRPLPEVPGVEHRHVDVGGLSVHVAEAGAGDPVVLLHGWPQHWYAWGKLIPELAKRYRVICPDLRGYGWTDAQPTDGTKEQLASDLIATLDALGLDRVRLVGHDWGGFTCQLAALHAPQRVERLAVLSIMHPWFRRPKSPAALSRAAYQFVIISPVGRRIVQKTGFIAKVLQKAATQPLDPEARASYEAQFRERERAVATVALYRAFVLRELGRLDNGAYDDRRLTVPTLMLYGDGDPVISREMWEPAFEHCDDLRVEEIAGAGHFPGEEQPRAVLDHLEPFLEGAAG